jgi:hypothetical protein
MTLSLEQLIVRIGSFNSLDDIDFDTAISQFLNNVKEKAEITSVYVLSRAYCDFILKEPQNVRRVINHIPPFYEILQNGLDSTANDET